MYASKEEYEEIKKKEDKRIAKAFKEYDKNPNEKNDNELIQAVRAPAIREWNEFWESRSFTLS